MAGGREAAVVLHVVEGARRGGPSKLGEGRRELDAWGIVPVSIMPSAAYFPGEPQFWSAGLKIDWEDNVARENAT